jgi:hypothetical protein
MIEQKLPDTFRIYFQNLNGFRLQNNGLDMLDFFCDMRHIEADMSSDAARLTWIVFIHTYNAFSIAIGPKCGSTPVSS